MKKNEKKTIAIIGAGVTGSVCANLLRNNGFNPIIIEKSSSLGGRLATRTVDHLRYFDHGVQYFTFRSEGFKGFIEKSLNNGSIGKWHPRFNRENVHLNNEWFVGQPNMNSFITSFLDDVEVNLGLEVDSISREGQRWRIDIHSNKRALLFESVVCTIPAPQLSVLLSSEKELVSQISNVEVAPCWALLLALENKSNLDFDVWRSDEENIAWISKNSSKPMRNGGMECWVVHASSQWSTKYIEIDKEQIVNLLLDELRILFGKKFSNIVFASAHRWRYARTINPLAKPYLCSSDNSLFVGGDWCLGSRVESAYQSGYAIANALIENRTK